MKNSPTDVVVSWSGGKDSACCLAALDADPDWRVVGLLTTVDEEDHRVPMHGIERRLVEAQAERLDLSSRIVELPKQPSNEVYERRMKPVFEALRDDGVETVAFGDLFLEDVRAYRERQIEQVGMKPIFPLWGRDTGRLAARFVDEGWRATISCVDIDQIDVGFLGRTYDRELLDDLPKEVDPCAEHGEFHTFVWDGPLFSSSISVRLEPSRSDDGRFQYAETRPPTQG